MIRLPDIPARYHARLAAERVDVRHADGDDATLIGIDGDEFVVAGSPVDSWPYADLISLPLTQRNVRALAVVLAEACGLDVSGGVTAETRPADDGRATLTIRAADGCAFTFGATHEALATLNPNDPDALGRALVACLRAVADEAPHAT